MSNGRSRHAVMIIDMPDATDHEIKAVFKAIRDCAARSEAPGWPEELAVLLDDAAEEFSRQVQHTMAEHRYQSIA